jgi:hypothetical protein
MMCRKKESSDIFLSSNNVQNPSLNSPQPEYFRLNIPGFKVIVISNSANLTNLDMQNLLS